MTVDELASRLSCSELAEWREYRKMKEEAEKKARREAKAKAKRRR